MTSSSGIPRTVNVLWNVGEAIAPENWLFCFLDPYPGPDQLKIKMQVRTMITFGDTGIGISRLQEIRDYVVGIIESFGPDFPK